MTDTLTRRLGRLPTETTERLRLAAVAGLDLDVRVLARVADGNELDVVELLEDAAGAGLVLESAADHYRFAHARVRSALRGAVSRSRAGPACTC